MNNKEFITSVAEKMQLSADEVRPYMEQCLGAIIDEVRKGSTVCVQGFGNFEQKEKAERKMYNPTTKDFKIIPKRNTFAFKVSTVLKDRFNK